MSTDADEQRRASRDAWEGVAERWGQAREHFQRAAAPVSAWMIDAIAPQPGHVVLELAAGPGDTGLMVAELIRPGGRLISTDGAEAMVAQARARGEQLGITNAEYAQMELEWIDMSAASVDGILCRWGYMLAVDPEAAARESRRVLRPGGRLAAAMWDKPELNPAMTAGWRALAGTPAERPPAPDGPGPFALSADGAVRELFESTGFQEVDVDTVELREEFASLDEAFAQMTMLSAAFSRAAGTLSPAEHTRMRDAFDDVLAEYVDSDGRVSIPGRTQVVAASA